MSARTVMTVMPVVMAKARAKTRAIFFMVVSPYSSDPQLAITGKELRDGHHVLEVFRGCSDKAVPVKKRRPPFSDPSLWR
jgi:hypothetical protein